MQNGLVFRIPGLLCLNCLHSVHWRKRTDIPRILTSSRHAMGPGGKYSLNPISYSIRPFPLRAESTQALHLFQHPGRAIHYAHVGCRHGWVHPQFPPPRMFPWACCLVLKRPGWWAEHAIKNKAHFWSQFVAWNVFKLQTLLQNVPWSSKELAVTWLFLDGPFQAW